MDQFSLPEAIAKLAEMDKAEWGKAKQNYAHCISVPRLRVLSLNQEFTTEEASHYASCQLCQDRMRKMKKIIWHPEIATLRAYHQKLLSDVENRNITYHLEHDRCKECLKLLKQFK